MIPRPTWDSIVLDAKANSFLERRTDYFRLFLHGISFQLTFFFT